MFKFYDRVLRQLTQLFNLGYRSLILFHTRKTCYSYPSDSMPFVRGYRCRDSSNSEAKCHFICAILWSGDYQAKSGLCIGVFCFQNKRFYGQILHPSFKFRHFSSMNLSRHNFYTPSFRNSKVQMTPSQHLPSLQHHALSRRQLLVVLHMRLLRQLPIPAPWPLSAFLDRYHADLAARG